MRRVSLSFELQYVECELAQKFAEGLPVVKILYDGHFERSKEGGGIIDIPLDADDMTKVFLGTLTGDVHRRVGRIPPTSSVGFASYALTRNQFGAICYVDAGTGHIELGTIAEHMRRGGTEPFEREIDLVLHTAKQVGTLDPGLKKGKLRFRVTALDMGGLGFKKGPTPLRAPVGAIDNTLVSYIKGTMDQELALRDTIPGTSRIHAPMDISESGIEFTKSIYLPVVAYAMFEVPKSNVHYWRNVFSRVMARRGLRMADFHELDLAHKAATMVQIMIFEAETFDYVGDDVDRNNRHERFYDAVKKMGYENFGDATVTTSGDCEDSACTIQMTFRAFMAFQFSPADRELVEMQTLGKQYLPMLTLAVVRGRKADDENAPKGAHMYVTFLTLHQAQKALSKTAEGRKALSNLPWDHTVEPNPGLPTLFGEGTGMINPLGYDDPLYASRRYLSQARSLAGFKKEIPHQRGAPSEFYMGNLLGITSQFFALGGNVGGFVFGTVNPRKNARGEAEMTRGTMWTDVINQSETVALLPQPPIPKPVMAIMREATYLRVPPNPMVLDPKTALGEENNPLLNQLVRAVASQNRPRGHDDPVDIFMRPHQFDENVIQVIIGDLMRLDRVWRVAYELEHVTTNLFQYRVMIYVK